MTTEKRETDPGLLDHLRDGIRHRSPSGLVFVFGWTLFVVSLTIGFVYYAVQFGRVPDIGLNHLATGDRFLRDGEYEWALAEFSTAAAIAPDDDTALFKLAVSARSAGQPQRAIEALRSLLRYVPRHVTAHYLLGLVYLEEGELEDAIWHNRIVVALSPGFAEAHNNLGNALQRSGDLEAAAQSYTAAVQANPGYHIARDNLRALRSRGVKTPELNQ